MFSTTNKKISIFLILLGIFYLLLTFKLPAYPYVPVDSDVVPIGLGVILLFLSVLLFFIKDEEDEDKQEVPKGEMAVILTVLGFVLLYVLFLEIIGFILATALFVSSCSRFLGYKHWLSNIIVSIAIPLFIYILFGSFLQIQLPQGILPF